MAGRASLKLTLAIVAAIILAALTHAIWLGWMGAFLIEAEEPVHADLIVVLAGDPYGHRILTAAELVKGGYAPAVLVSGPAGFYGMHESELAIPFAVHYGYPAKWFIPFPHEAHSTDEEARAIFAELQKRGVHRAIVVTSNYHTRRAARILRSRWPGIEIHMVAAPDEFFTPHGWWHSREGQKTFFLEWTKTLTSAVGI